MIHFWLFTNYKNHCHSITQNKVREISCYIPICNRFVSILCVFSLLVILLTVKAESILFIFRIYFLLSKYDIHVLTLLKFEIKCKIRNGEWYHMILLYHCLQVLEYYRVLVAMSACYCDEVG